jgi:F-type H+-transporting ATPase subunit gamma
MFAARPYARKMMEVLNSMASRATPDAHPLLQERGHEKVLLVVITADKGLCGAFNANIIRTAARFLADRRADEVALSLVGRKGRDFFRRRGQAIKHEMLGFWDRLAYDHASELADYLMRQYLDGEVDEVHLLYNEFRSVAVQRPVREQLLPIPRAEAGEAGAAAVDYIYEPAPAAILNDLLPRHVRTQVFRALMESLAGEYGARMTAMEAATKNAKEMIGVLTIQYNKARQEKITKELLDIVGGAEALKQGAEA